MIPENAEQLAQVKGFGGRILLLADDGRMVRLLGEQLSDYPLDCEANVLHGIMRLNEEAYQTVLLNAERLGPKTAEVVEALRRVNNAARLVLYGEPYAEVHARAAINAGADDYLVWPILPSQLRRQLGAARGRAITDRQKELPGRVVGADQIIEAVPVEMYRELAQLIPKGKTAIINRAQEILAQVLRLGWVEIRSGLDRAAEQSDTSRKGTIVKMESPGGGAGEIILGPSLATPVNGQAELAEQMAGFVGTLLYLAGRDENLKHLATVDDLTGAYNRRYFNHFAGQVIEQSKHKQTKVTLLLFDIDEFKYFNDKYGHSAGDEILRQTIKLMRRCCRSHDVVSRFGGDEFAVLFWDTGQPRRRRLKGRDASLPDEPSETIPSVHKTHPEKVVFMSNRFRRLMATSEFPNLGPDARGVLSISGGLASFPWDGRSVQELLDKADEALLSAKRSGKNRIYLVGQPNSV